MNTALHLLVFAGVGAIFPLLPMVLGKLLRPKLPSEAKEAIYECGEETIGSSYIRFDLRFYVVALLFIVFDVELLFFFPWAVVFGRATRLADPALPDAERQTLSDALLVTEPGAAPMVSAAEATGIGWLAVADLLIFFFVVLVGYAYLWKMGDLDWVRSVQAQTAADRPSDAVAARAAKSLPIGTPGDDKTRDGDPAAATRSRSTLSKAAP